MKLMTTFFSALMILAFSTVASAGSSGRQAISYFKIDQNRLVIFAAGAGITFTDDASCKDGTTTSNAVAISTSRDNFKELYAAVMLAHANKRDINFWLDGGCTPATSGGPFPTAEMVYVY